ncbi:MAG: hypothetical protein ABIJ18_05110 [archaeon]
MASVLDLGILSYFAPIFIFFLILVVVWAILEKTELFGKKSMIHWVIALCTATLVMIFPGASDVVQIITPWFAVLFIFLSLLIMIFLFMGVKGGTIADAFGKNNFIIWVVVLVCFGIFGYAMMQVYGDAVHNITSPEDGDNLNNQIGQILFNPKIMGVILVLAISGMIVRFATVTR